jgi:uncharacterized membrane protein YhhN
MLGAVLFTLVALAVLLVAEYRGWFGLKCVAKPAASAGFIGTALAAGALETSYGCWVMLGLGLSMLGDVLLIPQNRQSAFRAGIASFLLAHLAYTAAFVGRGFDPTWGLTAFAVVTAIAAMVLSYLRPHVPGEMRPLVAAYVVVISAMVVSAAASMGRVPSWPVMVGACGFYLSDLAVARERFVIDSFLNRLWGLPLYYGAQLVLASSVAGATIAH